MCLAQWAMNGPWPAVGSHRGNANPDRTLTHATHRHTHTHTHTRVTSAKGNHLQPPPPLSGTPIQGRSGTLGHLE